MNMFKIWRFYELSTYLLILMGFSQILRAIDCIDLIQLELAFYVLYSLIFCVLCLLLFKKIIINKWAIIILSCIWYPFFIGIFNKNFNVTFIMDTLLYFGFFLKLTFFGEYYKYEWFRIRCHMFLLRASFASALVGLISSLILMLLSALGYKLYFNTTPEITYGLVNALCGGNYIISLFYIAVSFLSGKRMIILGAIIAILLVRKRYNLKNILLVLFVFFISIFLFSKFKASHLIPFYKITSLVDNFSIAKNTSKGFLKSLDHHRFNEVLAIFNSMNDFDYILGKGYGFRYLPYDNPELINAGVTYSNSHFTPIGILSKFGIVGFIFFYGFFFYATIKSYLNRNIVPHMYVIYISLVVCLIQACFAYILFNSIIFGILLSNAISYSVKNREYNKSRAASKMANKDCLDGLGIV